MVFLSVVKALFDYYPKDSEELEFHEGDVLCVLQQNEIESEWLNACLVRDQSRVGMIPSNYVTSVQTSIFIPFLRFV